MSYLNKTKANRKVWIWVLVALVIVASIATAVVMIEKRAAAVGQSAKSILDKDTEKLVKDRGPTNPSRSKLTPFEVTSFVIPPLVTRTSSLIAPTETATSSSLPADSLATLSSSFAPSPSAAPSGSPTNTVCPTMRVRKSWQELTPNEKTSVIAAMKGLKQRPSQRNEANLFEDFVTEHREAVHHAHMNSRFLPWHRVFLQKFETALIQIDASVSLPYWDWALDSQNPRASSVFAPDAFGGDGGGPGRKDRCVNDGPFVGWMSNFTNPPSCLERKIDYRPWANSATMAAITGNYDDFSTFSSTFERSAHGAIHLQIGGDMVITEKSSNDPLFWLHHANVDRYFYIWQTQHPNSRYNSKENIPESDALMFLNAPVSAGMARPDRSADFCYEYSSSVQAAQGPLRRRSEQGQAQHLKLKHPTPLPEAWLKRMKFDVAETRAFEAQERKFIDMLNEGNYAAPSALVEEQREHQGKVVFEPVKTHPWRFTSEQMEGLKQVWNAAEEPKE